MADEDSSEEEEDKYDTGEYWWLLGVFFCIIGASVSNLGLNLQKYAQRKLLERDPADRVPYTKYPFRNLCFFVSSFFVNFFFIICNRCFAVLIVKKRA